MRYHSTCGNTAHITYDISGENVFSTRTHRIINIQFSITSHINIKTHTNISETRRNCMGNEKMVNNN